MRNFWNLQLDKGTYRLQTNYRHFVEIDMVVV
jgi:hypothetical protein